MGYVLIPACAVVLGLLAWKAWQAGAFVIAVYKDSREADEMERYESGGRR